MTENKTAMNITEIQKILPHRYPFLLVDKVLELEEGKKIIAIKNVTFNEPFFLGHFPDAPVMPGVLIMEALAQAAGILLMKFRDLDNKLPFFMSMDKVKFRNPVQPGDILRLEVEVIRDGKLFSKVHGKAIIDPDIPAAEGELTAAILDKDQTLRK